MPDLHSVPMPPLGSTVSYLSGSIVRVEHARFLATAPVPPNVPLGSSGMGRHYRTSHRCTQPDTAYRAAMNFIRRQVGLPQLPRLCSQCAERPAYRASHLCRRCTSKHPEKWVDVDEAARPTERWDMPVLGTKTPLPALAPEKGRDTHAADNARAVPGVAKADDAKWEWIKDGRRFRDALARADRIILERGGEIPGGYHFEDFAARFARMRMR